MKKNVKLLGIYLHLSCAATLRQQLHTRDKLLIIAGMIANHLGAPAVSAYCRHLVLEHNPQHLIRRWTSLSRALEHEEFDALLKQLQRRYPLEKAEHMLSTLEIEVGQEWNCYNSVEEYAAAVLQADLEQLQEIYLREQDKSAEN